MSLVEGFRLAWRGVMGNKMRSFLTALGVIIGVAAVIALVSVGQGANSQVTAQVQGLGTNLLQVIPFRFNGAVFTLQNTADIQSRVPEVTNVMPVLQGNVTARWSDQTWQTQLQGVTEVYPQVKNAKLQSGSFFTAADVQNRSKVAIIGQTTAQELKMFGNPVGQTITLNGQPFTVIGELAPIGGAAGGQNQDDTVIVPVTAAERVLGTTSLSYLAMQAVSAEEAPLATAHLQAI